MDNTINLAWMYPDILNLHGERGNVQCFKYVADLLSLNLNIDRIDNIEEKINFDKYDILIFNCGELKVVPTMLEFLAPQKENLEKFISDKKYLITTGTTSCFLGNNITRLDGTSFNGLNIMNIDFKERDLVVGDDLYFSIDENMEIIGSQIQMVDVNINDETPLGDVQYGYGNNGTDIEGARKENVIFSNCLGPVFVKNPWFAEKILKDICNKKNIKIKNKSDLNFDLEKKSFDATKLFIEQKIENIQSERRIFH